MGVGASDITNEHMLLQGKCTAMRDPRGRGHVSTFMWLCNQEPTSWTERGTRVRKHLPEMLVGHRECGGGGGGRG